MAEVGGLELLEAPVRRAVEEVVALGARAVAAFDADGTLWAGDIGEDLLRELHRDRRLVDPPPGDPFAEYERLLLTDPPRAFARCVELMRGLEAEAVARWSRELYRRQFAGRVFPSMRAILDALRCSGARIVVVSASSVFTIRAAAAELGLERAEVLAVGCPVDATGRLTGAVELPVTCGEGKAFALRHALGGAAPEIAFGNSLFDREMLECATRAVLVAPPGAESPAVGLARQREWAIHRARLAA